MNATAQKHHPMTGYPVEYAGFDGVRYRASYRPGGELRVSVVTVERIDGEPVIVSGRTYPAGYVAGWGDLFAEVFLRKISKPCESLENPSTYTQKETAA